MKSYYIGADVHCNNTELAVEQGGRIIDRYSVSTKIDEIAKVLDEIEGKKHLTFEEGPMAGWLYRNLKGKVDSLIVCDPRRNRLIADEGDKDDLIDAAKLAALCRGKYLKDVYHTEDQRRLELKYWVEFYNDRVRQSTRYINRLRAQCRMYGLQLPTKTLKDIDERGVWLQSLKDGHLSRRLELLWLSLDVVREQKRRSQKELLALSIHYPIIRYWSELPGIGLIRAVTLFAYLDTPFRFKKKSALWKYCGLGISRKTSGKDKQGRNKRAKLSLEYHCNRKLKNVIMGAALNAIHTDNCFRRYYEELILGGTQACNARHSVARKMLTIMWGMWKSQSRFAVHT